MTPLFCTAIAAAIGYYVLSNAHFVVTIIVLSIVLAVFCFFNVLVSFMNIRNTDTQNVMRQLRLTAFCSTAFAVGLVIGICAASAGRNEVKFGVPDDRITAVQGILSEDPRILSSGTIMAVLSLRRSAAVFGVGENVRVSSSGEITVFFPPESAQRLREFGRGTEIFAEGALRVTDRGWSFSARSLHIVKPAPAIERMRTGIRLNLINRFEGKPFGGLTLALLVGIRDNLDVNFAGMYREAGLSYILALSGMHLAIIAAIISFLLKKPLGLKAALIAGAVIISLYCLFVGPMPSLVRSVIMYLLGVLVILGALPKKPMLILCLSFLIQIIIAPLQGNTISFILSYLALIGIFITGQQLSLLLAGKIPDFLLQPLSMSCGAFIATAAVCSFTFGVIAPIGIIASLAVIPLTTIFMIGSIIWLVLDLFSFSFILNFPLTLLYRMMEIIASASGNIPVIRVNPVFILMFSIALILSIAALEHRRRILLLRLPSFL
jgi:competence protein ComEC